MSSSLSPQERAACPGVSTMSLPDCAEPVKPDCLEQHGLVTFLSQNPPPPPPPGSLPWLLHHHTLTYRHWPSMDIHVYT